MANEHHDSVYPYQFDTITGVSLRSLGITKREYFAALVLQGLLASDSEPFCDLETFRKEIGEMSVRYADSLIEALNESSQRQTGQ